MWMPERPPGDMTLSFRIIFQNRPANECRKLPPLMLSYNFLFTLLVYHFIQLPIGSFAMKVSVISSTVVGVLDQLTVECVLIGSFKVVKRLADVFSTVLWLRVDIILL